MFKVLCWAVISILLGGACYFIMATFGYLQSTQYGVAVQVFGNCKDNNLQCVCLRYIDRETIVLYNNYVITWSIFLAFYIAKCHVLYCMN